MSAPPPTTPASPELTKRFAVFLKGVIDGAGFPPGEEGDTLRRQIAGRLTREFEQPRTQALEFVLQGLARRELATGRASTVSREWRRAWLLVAFPDVWICADDDIRYRRYQDPGTFCARGSGF